MEVVGCRIDELGITNALGLGCLGHERSLHVSSLVFFSLVLLVGRRIFMLH